MRGSVHLLPDALVMIEEGRHRHRVQRERGFGHTHILCRGERHSDRGWKTQYRASMMFLTSERRHRERRLEGGIFDAAWPRQERQAKVAPHTFE